MSKLQKELAEFLKSNPEKKFKASDLSKIIGADAKSIGCALSALYRKKLLNREFDHGISVWWITKDSQL
mgnify:CR=1 FL=1